MNAALHTRRLYGFERMALGKLHPLLTVDQTILVLRCIAGCIWRHEGRARQQCPKIIAGRGTPSSGRLVSYCEGRSLIVLARNERNINTLIHELTHAMGYGNPHGPGFARKYFQLLGTYTAAPYEQIVMAAQLHGVKL